jgi:hypothetical protein
MTAWSFAPVYLNVSVCWLFVACGQRQAHICEESVSNLLNYSLWKGWDDSSVLTPLFLDVKKAL